MGEISLSGSYDNPFKFDRRPRMDIAIGNQSHSCDLKNIELSTNISKPVEKTTYTR